MVISQAVPWANRKVELRLKSFTVLAERQAHEFGHRDSSPKGGLPQPFVLIGRERDRKTRLLLALR